jgi:hypothetical protein
MHDGNQTAHLRRFLSAREMTKALKSWLIDEKAKNTETKRILYAKS